MTLLMALRLSKVGVATRYDDAGHVWLYGREKSYIMVATDIPDITGDESDTLWAEKPVADGGGLEDWEPYDDE